MNIISSRKFLSGKQTLQIGRFVRIKDKNQLKPFLLPTQSKTMNDLVHIFTLEGVKDIYTYQVKMLQEAKHSINLVSFVFDDGPLIMEIIKVLIEKVRQGVAIKVFTTLKANDFKVASIAESEDIDFNHHMKVVKELAKHGISIRARKDCHGKFCIVDRKVALISSSNLTEFSYNRNPEFGCYYSNQIEVLKLDYIFNHLWESAYEFYVNNDSGKFFVEERKPAIKSYKELFPFKKQNQDYEILYTYVENKKFSETVTHLFKQAKKEIIISTYLVRSLNNTSVGIELLNALDRGVKVTIITRPANRRSDHLEGCQQLAEKGAKIYGNLFNHAKIFTIDEQSCVIFTGNLDGIHGIENGIEFGIFLKNPTYIQFPFHYNQYLLDESSFLFTNGVTQEILSETQNQKLSLGELILCIPEKLNIGRTTIDGQLIYNVIGNDEIRISLDKDTQELKIIIPEFALIFHHTERSIYFLTRAFHLEHSVYQKISKELSNYLIETMVELRFIR